MDKLHLLLLAGWILFCIIHSVFATKKMKTLVNGFFGPRFTYYRIIYNLIALVSLVLLLIFQFNLSSPSLFEETYLSRLIGIFLVITGGGIMIACIYKYFIG